MTFPPNDVFPDATVVNPDGGVTVPGFAVNPIIISLSAVPASRVTPCEVVALADPVPDAEMSTAMLAYPYGVRSKLNAPPDEPAAHCTVNVPDVVDTADTKSARKISSLERASA